VPITLIAPPITPMDSRCNINLQMIEPMAAHLSRSGVAAVFVCGSTGEGMSLTIPERKQLTEAWMAHAPNHGLGVIAQIGTNSQPDAVELAKHAAALGVDAISAHAPCYFKPASIEELIDYFVPIADAASETPFYFYDIPQMTGVRIVTSDFLREAKNRITSLRGVKFTNSDLVQFQKCLHLDEGAFEVWWGCDEALLAGYALGVTGAIGSTYNFMAPLMHDAIAAFDAGEFAEARQIQRKVVDLIDIAAECGFLTATKVMMNLCGLDCGPVRAPLRRVSAKEERALLDRFRAIGFPIELPSAIPAPHIFRTNGQPASSRGQHATRNKGK
jgi:N-acetylneuraminate lyase